MPVQMSEKTRTVLKELEKDKRFPSGILVIDEGKCPLGETSPEACLLCRCGHMLECHYPRTCDEAECSHARGGSESR